MTRNPGRLFVCALLCLALGGVKAATIDVALFAFNDLHGNLTTPDGTVTGQGGAHAAAGGMEHLATLVRQLRTQNRYHALVAAGDLVGASPVTSSLLHDEPTIAALDDLGLEVSALGNHEFDHGVAELQRLQHGGCHPVDGCRFGARYRGARFRYLAANVVDARTGRTIFPPYVIKRYGGVPVAFVGVVLRATPSIVIPSGVAGVRFRDEAQSVNALVPVLRRRGVEAIVVLIHEGGRTASGFDDARCADFKGPIVDVVRHLDPAVDVVVSGHTHQPYICRVDNRLVTQAGSYGRYLTEIHLTIDRRTRDVVAASAHNHVVDAAGLPPDAAQGALLARAAALTAPVADARVASLASVLSRREEASGESALGDLITDAQLWATSTPGRGGAQIALTNPGGMRADLTPHDGIVTYGDVFAAQPFGNSLVVMQLSGAQLKEVLEQQWSGKSDKARILQVSRGFAYTWDAGRPAGDRVLAQTMSLNGEAIAPEKRYRVAVNSFMAEGGDGFTQFRDGGERMGGALDVDALVDYLRFLGDVPLPAGGRISRLN